MKILFLYPNKEMVTRAPLGLAYMASHLKKAGHEVQLFDTTFIKCGDTEGEEALRANSLQVVNPDLTKYGLIGKEANVFLEFEKMIQSFNPDIVGMTAVDPNYEFGLEFLNFLKKNHPNIKTIMGGPVPTFIPDEVIANDCVDMICLGEGEEAIVELADAIQAGKDFIDIKNLWVKKEGKIYKNFLRPLQNLDNVLAPDTSIFDDRHLLRPLGGKVYRMATIIWTRGCLFHCKYCANSNYIKRYEGLGRFYRIKDTKLLIKELVDAKQKYNLEFLFFVDDIFPLHVPEILDEFCRLYKEQVDLPFSINLQPTLVTEEALKKVIDAGCVNICVGLESGSPEIRKNVLGRIYENEQVVKVFNLAHKYKIRSSSFNMIGLPSETKEDIFKTIELNRQANPTSATLTFFHPYRGCDLRELCIKEGYFNPDKKEDHESLYRENSNLCLPQISNEELRKLFNSFQLYFKLPKEFWPLIELSEKEGEFSKYLREEILKPAFKYVTRNEAVWDFSKKSSNCSNE